MRGKPRGPRSLCSPVGLIPAHAGKTSRVQSLKPSGRAHPRACGENTETRAGARGEMGSSPRMRGKRLHRVELCGNVGLIPAHAGKTLIATLKLSPHWAHPRACGENGAGAVEEGEYLGSSPRMRGKPLRPGRGCGRAGLIPAHAGKTGRCSRRKETRRAHPRACGENSPFQLTAPRPSGSSPRMRGKPEKGWHGGSLRGLIPAHAGKTIAATCFTIASEAHPRACGENLSDMRRAIWDEGSSPRMRGKRLSCLWYSRARGLIPAHAGKTPKHAGKHSLVGAHPRACGENRAKSFGQLAGDGSSPRMRGKRDL